MPRSGSRWEQRSLHESTSVPFSLAHFARPQPTNFSRSSKLRTENQKIPIGCWSQLSQIFLLSYLLDPHQQVEAGWVCYSAQLQDS